LLCDQAANIWGASKDIILSTKTDNKQLIEGRIWFLSIQANNKVVALWPYSAMNDERVIWGKKFVILTHDSTNGAPFKCGLVNTGGWAAYFNHDSLFVQFCQHMK
jgi:hypothetical protein